MDKLTVAEVTRLLRDNGIPEPLLNTLAENQIDGLTLLALIADFTEFQHVVPQSGYRMRLKGVVERLCYSFSAPESTSSTSLSSTCDLISASLGVIAENHNWDPVVPPSVIMPNTTAINMPNASTSRMTSNVTNHQNESEVIQCQSVKNEIMTNEVPPARKKMALTKPLTGAPNSRARLPDPCPVPANFSIRVTKALDTGELEGNDQLCLLREAAGFFSGYCPNPSPAEYIIMSKTLCDHYPMLKDRKPVDGEYWESTKKYLSQRYRNVRRPPEPRGLEKHDKPRPQKLKSKLITMVHAHPVAHQTLSDDITPGPEDDRIAYDRNVESLNEAYLNSPNNETYIYKLMKHTFKLRREEINNSISSVTDLKTQYPYFTNKKWVQAEFNLMCGEGSTTLIADNWAKYLPAILKFGGIEDSQISSSEDAMYKAMEIMDKKLRPSGAGANSPSIYSVYECGTNLQDILKEKNTFAEPRLIVFVDRSNLTSAHAQGFIIAEKEMLFEIPSFTVAEGIISILATYYAYYINYPKSLPAQSFLLFVQEILLGKDSVGIKRSSKYSTFINYILKE